MEAAAQAEEQGEAALHVGRQYTQKRSRTATCEEINIRGCSYPACRADLQQGGENASSYSTEK